MNRRLVVLLSLVVTVVAVGLTSYTLKMAQRPLYEVGRVGKSQPAPPVGIDGGVWELEPGISVAVHRAGEGPRILLVHGGPGVPFGAIPPGFDRLALEGYEVITWDQRGCGASTRPVQSLEDKDFWAAASALEVSLGLTAQVADIERIRQGLGEQELVLVGHGFGALLASLYAAEFPQRIKALVLVAPDDLLLVPSPHGSVYLAVRGQLPEPKRIEYESYLRLSNRVETVLEKKESELAAFNAMFAEYYQLAAGKAGFAVPPVDAARTGGFSVQAALLGLGMSHDWRPAMRWVAAPVLVIHGGKDLMPADASRDIAAAFPRARVELIPAAGHFPHLDAPQTVARLVATFLASTGHPPGQR